MGFLKTTILKGFFLFLVTVGFNVRAQDVSFSQFYANPLYLNPAFAGSVGVPRAALQYRNQWNNFSKAFNTYSASFDMPVEKLRGGLGFYILNDGQAGNAYRSLQVNAAYSVNVKISEFYRLLGGIQFGYNRQSLDAGKLVFPDNVDPVGGNHGVSAELEYLADEGFGFPDFSTGILLYGPKIFGGLALHHIAELRHSFYSGNDSPDKLHRKYTAHFGARLPVFLYGHHRKKFDVSPQLVMQYQRDFGQMNYGIHANLKGITAGSWFRQNFGLRYDAVIFLAGFSAKQWQITYTYDMVVSGLWGATGGTSEISFVWLLKKIERAGYLPFYNFFDDDTGFQ